MNVENPEAYYQKKIKELNDSSRALKKRQANIAYLRLAIVLLATTLIYFAWGAATIVLVIIIAALAIFLPLVSLSARLKQKSNLLEILTRLNLDEIEIMNGTYSHRFDGLIYEPPHHPYSNDLDILGKASIYQFINRTTSEQGRQMLAQWLLSPADIITIADRQQAAVELRNDPEWRQQLQARGFENAITAENEMSLTRWLSEPLQFSNKNSWRLLRYLLPAISLSMLALHIAGIVPASVFYLFVIIFLALSAFVSKLVTPQYHKLSKHIAGFETLSSSLQHIESKNFESAPLQKLKSSLKSQTSTSASTDVRNLKKILDRMDYRLNPLVFIPLNIFLFWDLQQVMQLEKWKSGQRNSVALWFSVIAEFECLSSLATLAFNRPAWNFAVVSNDWFHLRCVAAGHPLIPEYKSVTNDINVDEYPQLCFITGSNMAGKSTFLRTIGTNLVLALCGAPVAAKRFETSVLKVMTSMRIADNLEESASTFSAELQKLKNIIDAVKTGPRVFILLDEILRGTNSLDRHTGSEALIRQLIKEKAVGMIASHDLSLATLEKEYPTVIHNYHFDVSIHDNELTFDYKLKPGVCETLNATILMKKIGIEI